MGTRATHALVCDGAGCQEVFFPQARLERYSASHLGEEARGEVMVVARLVSAVRTEALRVGWSHVFHPRPTGNGPGWYEDWCPTCTTKEPSRG